MFTAVDATIVFLFVVLALFYVKDWGSEVMFVTSEVDGRDYLVQKHPEQQLAADKLARMNASIEKLIKHLQKAHGDDPGVKRLTSRYSYQNISQGTGDDNYTAYSVNKGEKIVFCLRSKDSGKLVGDNVLMYVAVHELAHVYTTQVGHTKAFWDNFRFLLSEAVDAGVYKVVDYRKRPVDYCGVSIQSSIL